MPGGLTLGFAMHLIGFSLSFESSGCCYVRLLFVCLTNMLITLQFICGYFFRSLSVVGYNTKCDLGLQNCKYPIILQTERHFMFCTPARSDHFNIKHAIKKIVTKGRMQGRIFHWRDTDQSPLGCTAVLWSSGAVMLHFCSVQRSSDWRCFSVGRTTPQNCPFQWRFRSHPMVPWATHKKTPERPEFSCSCCHQNPKILSHHSCS